MKVFLGGTVNGSKWRQDVMEQLTIDYFDPVVEDWNDAAYERELSERRNCNYLLYVLTPKMTGFYAIAEVTDDSYRRPDRTLYCYLEEDGDDKFSPEQIAQFEELGDIVTENGATWFKSMDEVVAFLNSAQLTDFVEESVGHDAFICYGLKESKDFANRLTNRLSERNYSIFQDLNDIPLIIDNEEYIYQQILKSDNFIYIISPNAVRSELCKKELDFAIRFNKRIIPILHHDLGVDSEYLDDIVAKKTIIEDENVMGNIEEIAQSVASIMETDRDYVKAHSTYLYKARKWDFGGRRQADLLSGVERKEATEWSLQKCDSMAPLKVHLDYIEASQNISVFMLPLLWLNKRTKALTQQAWFDKVVLIFSLANPAALSLTLIDQFRDPKFTVSLPMFFVFFAIQVALTFDGIKHKNFGLFISMLLSMIITSAIIAISFIRIYEI